MRQRSLDFTRKVQKCNERLMSKKKGVRDVCPIVNEHPTKIKHKHSEFLCHHAKKSGYKHQVNPNTPCHQDKINPKGKLTF